MRPRRMRLKSPRQQQIFTYTVAVCFFIIGLFAAAVLILNDVEGWVHLSSYPAIVNIATAGVGFLVGAPIVVLGFTRLSAAQEQRHELLRLGRVFVAMHGETVRTLSQFAPGDSSPETQLVRWHMTQRRDVVDAIAEMTETSELFARTANSSTSLPASAAPPLREHLAACRRLHSTLSAVEQGISTGSGFPVTYLRHLADTVNTWNRSCRALAAAIGCEVEGIQGPASDDRGRLSPEETMIARRAAADLRSVLSGEGPLALALLAASLSDRRQNVLVIGDSVSTPRAIRVALGEVLGIRVVSLSAEDLALPDPRDWAERNQRLLEILASADCLLVPNVDRMSAEEATTLGKLLAGELVRDQPEPVFFVVHSASDPREIASLDSWVFSRFAYRVEGLVEGASPSGLADAIDIQRLRDFAKDFAERNEGSQIDGLDTLIGTLVDRLGEECGDARRGQAFWDLWCTMSILAGRDTYRVEDGFLAIPPVTRNLVEPTE